MTMKFYAPEISNGELLGDYQVLGVLGRGPTGVTYHVVSTALGKEFALRALVLSKGHSLEWVHRLDAQTALMTKLAHPYIDKVISSGHSRSLWFCLKDFIHDGQGKACHLGEFRERFGGRLSHHQVYHITRQMTEALDYASRFETHHQKGVSHGNLKPQNVLVAFSEEKGQASHHVNFEVKLTDFQPFGLMGSQAILETFSEWIKSLDNYSARISEEAVGHALSAIYTPFDYRAPEWKSGGTPVPTEDLYAVGVLVYEMLTGHLPEGRFPMPSECCPNLPSYWDRLIMRCLQPYPEARYQSFAEFLEDLRHEGDEEEIVNAGWELKPRKRERLSLTPRGMVYIPAGYFMVGSEECGQDASPAFQGETEGFYMDRSPVTNYQFAQFVSETGYLTDMEREGAGPVWLQGEWHMMPGISWKNPIGGRVPVDFPDHPVTQVTLADAQAYAEWAERRLPTEVEWEYAARGGLRSAKFPWGDTISRTNANYGTEGTSPVGTYQANGYGLLDMAGNVWEWTASPYRPYPGSSSTGPHFDQGYQVVRGGAWLYDGAHCQVAYRNANQPDRGYPTLGFRTVCDFNPG